MALITKKNTNIGATPFSDPTNNVPNTTTILADFGAIKANIIPIIKPINILFTKLISFHFANKFFMFTPLNSVYFL